MDEATRRMVLAAVKFADWAAGEGITPPPGDGVEAPDDFLFAWASSYADFHGEYANEFAQRMER